MKILVIDTSTSMATVALAVDEKVVAESCFNSDRTLSARLIPEIMRILAITGVAAADIDLFASSIGPGSFTGVRGGVATVQGLALAAGKPCVGFSSLALLAMNFPFSSHPVCSLLDARKSEVYAALFDCSAALPNPLMNDCVMSPASFFDRLCSATGKHILFAGEGAIKYRELIAERMPDRAIFAPFQLHISRAANATMLALDLFRRGESVEPSALLPVYLRASDAEINRIDLLKIGNTTI
ncbi:MAG: tRNA (adenosine(37)-N6)-threonylcarbamoyltransferase complex dimerization subunit type 1 TsaB [Desulfuromonadaceae bacterium]|nr:tRNA (adenosine(37)-N6)-threonylcarbamoyltransferase complex dimerization subunit type 1 TsaB [Desulfuromonadaceae bacterium]